MFEQALLLGLSTGPYCLGYCLPVLLPLTCATPDAMLRTRAVTVARFSAGRFVAYLAFGALAGYLGHETPHPTAAKVSAIAVIVLSILLMVFGLIRTFPRLGLCTLAGRLGSTGRLPVVMGFLTGLNACPPFLLAVTFVFTAHNVVGGLTFFAIYFVVTSVYLVPLIFIGQAARFEKVRWVAQVASILAGLLFLKMGLTRLLILGLNS